MEGDTTTIREVDPARAEAVLSVRLSIPGVAAGTEDEYHLARVKPPARVVESRTVNPDGSITETSTLECAPLVMHSAHADGRTADGRGCGYGKTVSLESQSADAVTVHMTMSWTDRQGNRGSLDEVLLVSWLGEARREVAGGWIEARITRVRVAAEPV